MRIVELFAGIGACSTALKRIGIDIEIVDAVEIDKYAIASFNAVHGTNFKPQDITKWNKEIKDIDLITHGSPCQDFSVAGKQAGGDIGSGTRSSLMYETIRIVGQVRPKYVLWENVKNLLSKKHKHNFDAYIETMNILGYNSYYQVLNAKDYGIPQNRERVYTISIRKDIDKGNFVFPEKEELKLRLKDMLEEYVDEKYYLSDVQIERIHTTTYNVGKTRIQEKEYCDTLCARDWKDPKCVQVGNLDIKGHDSIKRIYSQEGISPTLTDMQGGNRQPKIIKYDIPQTVKVRKYPVNIEKLKETLRNAKIEQDITNSRIAFELDVPITTVEHWFRKDNCFAIPDEDIWFDLKSLLNITTDEFDESIMIFEEKDGIYDKANRVYDEQGVAPTLTQQEEKILIKNATQKGYDEAIEGDSINLQYPDSNTRRGRVGHQVSQTLQCNDSMGVVTQHETLKNKLCNELIDKGIVHGITPTLTTRADILGYVDNKNTSLRIRKLTPKECWRLMGFSDEDFEKAANIPTSNAQLYKQARKLNLRTSIRKNFYTTILILLTYIVQ